MYVCVYFIGRSYEVQIDGKKEESGSLYDDFDFLKPKEINDPTISKPKVILVFIFFCNFL